MTEAFRTKHAGGASSGSTGRLYASELRTTRPVVMDKLAGSWSMMGMSRPWQPPCMIIKVRDVNAGRVQTVQCLPLDNPHCVTLDANYKSPRDSENLAGSAEAGLTNSDVVFPRCRVAESGREGRLTRPPLPLNPLFTMGLSCIPKPCSCGITWWSSHQFGVRKGYTHPKQTPCPFTVHDFPTTRFGTCCSFKVDAAQSHLHLFGEYVLEERMGHSMTAEQALYFAEDLRRAMDRLEVRYLGAECKPEGAGYIGYWHKNKTEKVWKRRSTFEDAVAAVRQAATWYEMVGSLGYGVAVK